MCVFCQSRRQRVFQNFLRCTTVRRQCAPHQGPNHVPTSAAWRASTSRGSAVGGSDDGIAMRHGTNVGIGLRGTDVGIDPRCRRFEVLLFSAFCWGASSNGAYSSQWWNCTRQEHRSLWSCPGVTRLRRRLCHNTAVIFGVYVCQTNFCKFPNHGEPCIGVRRH